MLNNLAMFLDSYILVPQSINIQYFFGINFKFFFLLFKNSLNLQQYQLKILRFSLKFAIAFHKKFYIFMSNFVFLKTLFQTFVNKSKELLKGYFVELDIKGLGYFSYFSKTFLVFDLNYSHFIGLSVPSQLLLKKFKTKIVLFGFNREFVMDFARIILNLKNIDVYKGKGIFIRGHLLKLKEIKKK